MLTRTLGRSGIQVSALGMGCWAIGGPFNRTSDGMNFEPMGWGQVDDAESIRAIHAAMDAGVTFFDTASNYGAGHSEVVLGQALKGRRERAVIATKFGSVFDEEKKIHYDKDENFIITPEFIRASCENSLHRLQTDYLDLLQFHWNTYDETRALDVRATLDELVQGGKIRWYGWSTDHPRLAAIFAEGEHCTSIQHRLNVVYDAAEMLTLCEKENLASINKSPLNSGLLTGKFHKDFQFPDDDGRKGIDWNADLPKKRLSQIEALRDVLTSGGRTMAQGSLAWIWARTPIAIPIPGFKNVKQATENARAMDFGPLTPEQFQQVEEILERVPATEQG